MKYELSIKERIIVANLLPQAKSLASMRVVADLQHTLGISAEEHEQWGIVEGPGRIEWKVPDQQTVKEFDLARKEVDLIAGALHKLSEDEKVTLDHLPLFDKFEVE